MAEEETAPTDPGAPVEDGAEPDPTAEVSAATGVVAMLGKVPVKRLAGGAKTKFDQPDTRRFLAGALVGALVLYAGGTVFDGGDTGAGNADTRVEALRADVAELRADLAEFRAGSGGGESAPEPEGEAAGHGTEPTGEPEPEPTTHDTEPAEHSSEPPDSEPAHGGGEPPHWTYAEATDWGTLADEYIECLEGQEQSPIDLSSEWDRVESTSEFEYDAVPVTVTDNGHTVQIAAEGAGTVTQQNHEYTLVQVHFHAPSEHTIDGEHHEVEAHLVHQDADGKLAVVGVMIDEGAPVAEFDAILDAIGAPGETHDAGEFDPSVLLPDARSFFHYRGSLTTPPCSEGVAWRVMTEPITMSTAQIDELTSHFVEENNRPVQPRNDRDAHIDE